MRTNKEIIRKLLPLTMLLLVVFFVMQGCKDPNPEGGDDTTSPVENSQPKVSDFSVTTCLSEDRARFYDNDTIYVEALDDNSVKIRTTNTYFNCCSEAFWEEVSVEGNDIFVSMCEDDKVPCDCVCPRGVEFVLKDLVLGQTYKIKLLADYYGYFTFDMTFATDTNLMFVREW